MTILILESISPQGDVFTVDTTGYLQELKDKKDTLKNSETAENLSYPFRTKEGLEGVVVFRSLSLQKSQAYPIYIFS